MPHKLPHLTNAFLNWTLEDELEMGWGEADYEETALSQAIERELSRSSQPVPNREIGGQRGGRIPVSDMLASPVDGMEGGGGSSHRRKVA